jgi:hypothetical protein
MLLHRLRSEAKDLVAMPETERVFVVVLGYIANEVNILQKLMLMAHDLDDDPEPAETQGRTAQTVCLLHVLLGKLCEAYRTIKTGYLDAGLHRQIEDRLTRMPLRRFKALWCISHNSRTVSQCAQKEDFLPQ